MWTLAMLKSSTNFSFAIAKSMSDGRLSAIV